jgi:ribonuclease PH
MGPRTVEVDWQRPISQGSTFKVTAELGSIFGRRTALCTLSHYEPNHEIGWETSQSGIGLKVVYSVEPIEGTKTKLSRALELKIGGRWKIISPLISRSARKGRDAEIINIKRIVEKEPWTPCYTAWVAAQ